MDHPRGAEQVEPTFATDLEQWAINAAEFTSTMEESVKSIIELPPEQTDLHAEFLALVERSGESYEALSESWECFRDVMECMAD